MDIERLSAITADAVLTVFHFRDRKINSLDDVYQRTIQDAIEDLWPLRPQARCVHVAHLEIASDAAVTCAEVFNQRNPEQAINERWVYMCVQNLLTLELQPDLLLDGAVGRLGALDPESKEHTRSSSPAGLGDFAEDSPLPKSMGEDDDVVDDDDGDGDYEYEYDYDYDDDGDDDEIALIMSDQDDDDRQTVMLSKTIPPPPPSPAAAAAAAAAAPAKQPKKEPKTPWTEEDIKRMVKLKDQEGLTHEEVASRIGRGKGSVENKYGRVVKEARWKRYAETCRRKRMGLGAPTKRRAQDEDEDEDEDAEGEGESRPVRKRQRR